MKKIGNTTQQVCPYAIHAFDLKNDRHILRYQFKDDDINDNTFIANIAVEVGETCDDTWIYASDELGYGLLVYSLKENDSWRFEHGFCYPDPFKGAFSVGGLKFFWESEGIFGLTLSPRSTSERLLFFHPLASFTEFVVPTRVLKVKPNKEFYYDKFIAIGERFGHSTSETMTEDGIMIFNLVDQNAVGCWNWNNPYNIKHQTIVAKDDVALIFPSDVRVTGGNIWVISDRMPIHLLSKLDFNDINFRVMFLSLHEAIAGTVCQHRLTGNHIFPI